jgi:sulfite exporter TauE/SafE
LGGIIGLIGSAFTLGGIMTLILGVLVGLVMLSLGINLLDIFPWATRFQPRMPAFLTNVTSRVKTLEHSIAPFLIGLSTFFLPCGFTQSMQVYSLSTGSFVIGALTMTAFALGTFPVLALISFTSVELGRGKWSGVFFKTAGLLVILFGMMNIINSFAGAGIIPPLFGF